MTDAADKGAPDAGPGRPVEGALGELRAQLDHLESLLTPETRAVAGAERRLGPAWRRTHEGEARFPVALAIVVAIGLQVGLPAHLAFKPTWLLPALEGVLLVGITGSSQSGV